MLEQPTTRELAGTTTGRTLHQFVVPLCSTSATALATAVGLRHSDAAPLLTITAPALGFETTAVPVAGFLLRRTGANPDRAQPPAQRPRMELRVAAGHEQQ